MSLINLDDLQRNETKKAEIQFIIEDLLTLRQKLEALGEDKYDFHIEKALMNIKSAIFNIESFLKGKSVE